MTPYTDQSTILALPTGTPEQAAAAICARPHGEYDAVSVLAIVRAYYATCVPVGVDPTVAIAQMCHETGNLTSALSQRYWYKSGRHGNCRNPAGIGVTSKDDTPTKPANLAGWLWDSDRNLWRKGCGFADWATQAIPAQVGRLLLYAIAPGMQNRAQQQLMTYALKVRTLDVAALGSASTLRPLGAVHNPANRGLPHAKWRAGWAWDGEQYGAQLATAANALRGGA